MASSTLYAKDQNRSLSFADSLDLVYIDQQLQNDGYCVISGLSPSLDDFSELIYRMCSTVTFDPARNTSADSIQKVDAGTDAIGLHIENGNTPNVPQLVGFYCRRAASKGSQTTLCDGAALLDAMPEQLKAKLLAPMTVTRTFPEHLWKAYLVQEHPLLQCAEQVTIEHLEQMMAMMPGQSGELLANDSLRYSLDIHPVRTSAYSHRACFANALLGPSFSYEKPVYTPHSGEGIAAETLELLAEAAEEITEEIHWHDGDIVLIDNWRVMHGRRKIIDAENRELFIGMGNR